MTSIPCTSHEQALAVIQHGWAVVDGVRRPCPKPMGHCCFAGCDPMECGCCRRAEFIAHEVRYGPPAEWLKALTCETCGNHGEVFASRDVERPELDRWYQCPDCNGAGKPRIPVTAHCDCPCHGVSAFPGGECVGGICTDGVLHVGWVTVTEVLPVLSEHDPSWATRRDNTVCVCDDGVVLDPLLLKITADVAHLGAPGDLIGRWLLKLEVVA